MVYSVDNKAKRNNTAQIPPKPTSNLFYALNCHSGLLFGSFLDLEFQDAGLPKSGYAKRLFEALSPRLYEIFPF